MPEAVAEGRGHAPAPKAWWTAIPESRGLAEECLAIDDQTARDLEIFSARGAGYSVQGLLSLTKTAGGAAVLRARMMQPWSSAHRIREVQASIRYIIAHRAAFDCLPSEVVAHGASEYLYGGLPVEDSRNPLVVLIEALSIRWGEFRYYTLITQGVIRATRMIHGLRRILDTSRFPSPIPGELGVLLEEMRGLLARKAFEGLPSADSWDLPFYTVFTLDRDYRGQEEEALRRLLRLSYRVDALVAMADATTLYGMVIPEVLDGPATLEAEGLFNLFITNPVPASIELGQHRHMLFLTGPNMAGKSTFLRSVGVALYLAHLGMGVPAGRFRFTPCQSLFAALNISDDIHGGVSFFRTEAMRMKAVAEAMNAGRRVVALVDEPFKGTNIKDAMDASWLVLEAFARATDGLFAVSSHLIELGDALLATDRVTCCRFEAVESKESLDFDFTLRSGISSQRLGMRVLEQEGLVTLLRDSSGRRAGE
ncbi:MAG: MutS-related protein [Longimicrobiales bacterium]